MNFFKKRNENVGFDDEDFYDGDYYKESKEPDTSFDGYEPVIGDAPVNPQPAAAAPVALRVIKPKSYDEAPEIADCLAGGSTVLLNIEELDRDAMRRLIDFLLGAVHVIGGSMKKVAKGTFVFAPGNVGVTEFEPEISDAVEGNDEN